MTKAPSESWNLVLGGAAMHLADLTDLEIDEICAGLRQNAAKVRYLRSLGLQVAQRPNGRPLVNRSHYNLIRGGSHSANQSRGRNAEPAWTVRA